MRYCVAIDYNIRHAVILAVLTTVKYVRYGIKRDIWSLMVFPICSKKSALVVKKKWLFQQQCFPQTMFFPFFQAALLAHDCVANTHMSINDNNTLVCHASTDIKKGEPIYYNYTDPLKVS